MEIPNAICVIPARGGSQRIPMKNIKYFHGKPIIAYSIEAAKKCGIFDRIVVSTDHQDIAKVARKYGAEVHDRNPVYGDDRVGTQEVMANCLKEIGAEGSDLACCLYATAPLVDPVDIVRAIQIYAYDSQAVYVFSVGFNPLHDAGQFYIGAAYDFMQGFELISPKSRMYPIAPGRDCDINTMEDWDRALRMYEELQK